MNAKLALIALLFPAVGALLAVWAVYAILQWRKFGNSEFELLRFLRTDCPSGGAGVDAR